MEFELLVSSEIQKSTFDDHVQYIRGLSIHIDSGDDVPTEQIVYRADELDAHQLTDFHHAFKTNFGQFESSIYSEGAKMNLSYLPKLIEQTLQFMTDKGVITYELSSHELSLEGNSVFVYTIWFNPSPKLI